MPNKAVNKIILFEYDKPIDIENFLNGGGGIWQWTIQNRVGTVEDDNGNTGYYEYQNTHAYNVMSLRVDNEFYAKMTTYDTCLSTNKSFYFDTSNTKLYVHFDQFEPPLTQEVSYGAATGYSRMPNNKKGPYFRNEYYEPRLISIPTVKKSIDPLFYGLLKYSSGKVKLSNADGHFDNWRSDNIFGQPARILFGDIDDDYSDFTVAFEGFISDDVRDFKTFSVDIEDPRKGLTQPVAQNILTVTDYPYLNDNNTDAVKPVAYGTIKNAKSICLNEDETTPLYYTFLICDTEFNQVSSLDKIYVDDVETAITGSTDLVNGIFTMTFASVDEDMDKVSIDFTATSFDNGVDIIKDLMLNYAYKSYSSSFWDIDEVDAAELLSRDTTLYIDKGGYKLVKAIESICVDIDGRFFNKNNGVYTIRIYDSTRTENTKKIYSDEWIGEPKINNNGSEFLSSAIIEYSEDIKERTFLVYENTDYRQEAFDRYKKLKTETFTTGLSTLADAMDKSETIMNISKEVQDVVKRISTWDNFGIEPTDFIVSSPTTRLSESDSFGVYEVLDVNNDLDDFKIDLTLRYVKAATPDNVYSTIDDNNDLAILDHNNQALTGRIS